MSQSPTDDPDPPAAGGSGAPRSASREIRVLTALAIPVALTQLGMMSMGLVDLYMVGRLGKEAIGGVALVVVLVGGLHLPGFL